MFTELIHFGSFGVANNSLAYALGQLLCIHVPVFVKTGMASLSLAVKLRMVDLLAPYSFCNSWRNSLIT